MYLLLDSKDRHKVGHVICSHWVYKPSMSGIICVGNHCKLRRLGTTICIHPLRTILSFMFKLSTNLIGDFLARVLKIVTTSTIEILPLIIIMIIIMPLIVVVVLKVTPILIIIAIQIVVIQSTALIGELLSSKGLRVRVCVWWCRKNTSRWRISLK